MNKHTVQRVFEVIHIVALSVWVGAAGMSGIVAAVVFPTMGEMRPKLGSYPLYTGDHALLGAGRIAGQVFLIVDTIQFICASIALGALITMIVAGYSINTLGRVARCVALLFTMGLLSWHFFILMPGMEVDLSSYWDLAAAGETVAADVHKDAFMALHETAANSLKGLTLGVLLSLIIAIWTGTGHTKNPLPPEPSNR